MSDSEKRNRIVDLIDVVKDNVSYFYSIIFRLSPRKQKNEDEWRFLILIINFNLKVGVVYEDAEKEDPEIYISEKTGRGPLNEDWIEEYSADCEGKQQPTENGCSIMCAYKLCKVEFRYWGMQSKIER